MVVVVAVRTSEYKDEREKEHLMKSRERKRKRNGMVFLLAETVITPSQIIGA